MPSLLILIPLLGLLILNMPFGNMMRRGAFWVAASLFSAQIAVAIYHRPIFLKYGLDSIDSFFHVGLSTDQLSFVVVLCVGIVSLASLAVARYTIPGEKDRFKFINLLMIASTGMCGIAIVKDLFSLYVFLEITAVASFILIAFDKDVLGLEGSFKYMIMSAVATIFMLTAIALIMLSARDTTFAAIRDAVMDAKSTPLITLAIALFISGLFVKGGLIPFHGWLPDAYSSAPASASVLLAGIVTKVCGIYTLLRIGSSLFGLTGPVKEVLMLIGASSILLGAFAAIGQTNFKRMLAYSSISQVGYIVLGFGVGTPLGLLGAIFHFFNHAIFKTLLFVNSAAVEKEAGTCDMNRLGGVAEKMPVTGATSVVAFLSASGIPPLAGFWSKLIIVIALWQNQNYAYASIAILAGILTLGYLLSMQRRVFFGKLAEGLEKMRETNTGIVIVSIALAAIIIAAGVAFPFFYTSVIEPAKNMLIR